MYIVRRTHLYLLVIDFAPALLRLVQVTYEQHY